MEVAGTRTEAEALHSETVFSSNGDKVGEVEKVLYDKATGEPEWLAVKSGLFGMRSRIVPFHGAKRQPEGVAVPYEAAQIESAPQLEGDEISQDLERQLASHYGLAYSESRSPTGLARGERRSSSESAGRKTSSRTGRSAKPGTTRSSRQSSGPTRDELYEEAQRLGIEGRSKMNKAQLQRAVDRHEGRGSSAGQRMASPFEVQKFLEAVGYPAGKRELVREAKEQGADARVRTTLEQLPDEEFGSPAEVSEAIGKLG